MDNKWLGCAAFLGVGAAIGAAGALLFSKNPGALKKGCATVLSHVLELKEKAATVMDTAKENIEDIAAEAKHDYEVRKHSSTNQSS